MLIFLKEYFLGYLLLGGAVGGYFGYYLPNEDAFIWMWVILAILGLLILVYKNSKKVPKNKKPKVIGLDILYIILIPLIASIPSPGGLSILLAMIVAGFLSFLIIQYTFNPWNNKSERSL